MKPIQTLSGVSDEQRRQMISEAAYLRAERRGFDGGSPETDWLEAEAEVDARLRQMAGRRLLEDLDERLAVANGRLRAFKKKVTSMKTEARQELDLEIEKLVRLRDSFKERLVELRQQGEHASDKAKQQAERIWQDISAGIERVTARGKSPPPR